MLKERIELLERFSIQECLNNPNKIYIFWDNNIRKCKWWQAIIRDCSNAFWIITKKLPMNTNDAFLSDNVWFENIIKQDLDNLEKVYNWAILVFPTNWIGTGLAQMKLKALELYKYLCDELLNRFWIINETLTNITYKW